MQIFFANEHNVHLISSTTFVNYHFLQTSPTTEDTPTSVQVGSIDEPITKVVVKPVNPDDKIEPDEIISVLVISCVESMIIVVFCL